MSVQFARREFLAGMAALTAANAASRFAPASRFVASHFNPADAGSPFRVSVINDEISQDFGHACEVASKEFGMGWIELRGMWKKNILKLDDKEVAEARRILEKYPAQGDRHCQPVVQSRLAGRAKIEIQRGQELWGGLYARSNRMKFSTAPWIWRKRFRPTGCAASISGG